MSNDKKPHPLDGLCPCYSGEHAIDACPVLHKQVRFPTVEQLCDAAIARAEAAEARVREMEAEALADADGTQAAQAVVEAQAGERAAIDRAEVAEVQLAALREAAEALVVAYDRLLPVPAARVSALRRTLTDAQPTAEAYKRQVQAEVLRRVAKRIDAEADAISARAAEVAEDAEPAYPRSALHLAREGAVREDAARLRAEAERIEGGGQ